MSSIRDIEALVLGGKFRLWLVNDEEDKTHAAGVTNLHYLDGEKIFTVVALSGTNMKMWRHLWPRVERYAREQGAETIQAYGRLGWQRILQDFKPVGVVLERRL